MSTSISTSDADQCKSGCTQSNPPAMLVMGMMGWIRFLYLAAIRDILLCVSRYYFLPSYLHGRWLWRLTHMLFVQTS
ncbi:MAG: hypothetical protein HKN47_12170 [Pirellulaceae bacterium]|nr:hypothetical protein [Pirellulaceae bacterium]